MKHKTENTILATAAFLLASTACVATNRVGLDDGDGGAAVDTGGIIEPPPGPAPVMAYALAADPTIDQLAVSIVDTGAIGGAVRVALLDADDGNVLRVLKPTASIAPYGFVAVANGIVALGDVSTSLFRSDGRLLREIPGALSPTSLTLSADGALLFTGDPYGTIRRYDTATGAEVSSPFAQLPLGDNQSNFVTSLAISPDGSVLAANDLTAVHVWRVSDRTLLAEIPSSPGPVTLSALGELAVRDALTGQAVTFYDLAGAQRGRYSTPGYGVYGVAYSADGTKVAIATDLVGALPPGGKAGYQIVVRIIDRASGNELAQLLDPQQGRPYPIGAKSVLPIGWAFVEHDSIVVLGWSDRRVTAFAAVDGVPLWTRVLDP